MRENAQIQNFRAGRRMPTINFNFETGELTAKVYVQVTREHECKCGSRSTIGMEWPEGVTVNGEINIKQAKCPKCGEPIVLPKASYYVENFRLLDRPME